MGITGKLEIWKIRRRALDKSLALCEVPFPIKCVWAEDRVCVVLGRFVQT